MEKQLCTAVKIIEWDMGHRVPNHKSKCRNVHGHRYLLEVHVTGTIVEEDGISEQGMVIDFSDIKAICQGWIDENLDHAYMGFEKDPMTQTIHEAENKVHRVNFIPTAENIARYLYHKLQDELLQSKTIGDYHITQLKLYETPKSYVLYPVK